MTRQRSGGSTRERYPNDIDNRAGTRYADTEDERYGDRDKPRDEYDEDDYDDEDSDDGRYDDNATRQPAEQRTRQRRSSGLSAADAAHTAVEYVDDLIGKPTLGVAAVKPSDDGWTVGVEVLEDDRVPSSADILALYEVDIDLYGTLLSYQRTRRYSRGRADSGGGG